MYDLVIIGGGPAGLTAAIYAIRKRLNVLLVSKDLGGKTNFRLALPWVKEYQVIRGLEVVNKFRSELEYLKFAHLLQTAERVERLEQGFAIHLREGETLQAQAVIVATGARQKRLSVPGEKEFMMRGLCYSAISYAPLFIDRKTVVIGDGELALRSTAELATVASHVYLVGIQSEALNSPLGRKLKSAQNVTILEGYQVIEVRGNHYAEGVMVRHPDGEQKWIQADGTFIELGLIPNSQLVADLVELDGQRRIIIDTLARTSVPGIFAAGDVTNLYTEQVLVAIGEGAKAALSAYEYLLSRI